MQKFKQFAGFLAVVLTVGSSAFAAEYFVPDGTDRSFHCQMTNALTKMTSGDILTIREGTYQLPDGEYMINANAKESSSLVLPLPKLTVRGDPNVSREKVVIRGSADKRGFYNVNRAAVIANLTFENFKANVNGAVCYMHSDSEAQAKNWIITNCVFRGCAGSMGGAVYCATLDDCVCTNNAATARGGVGCSLIAKNCYFENNSASQYGGALHNPYFVTNCTFKGNKVTTYDGGAICSFSNPIVCDCDFEDNVAARHGGVAYQCQLEICRFWGANIAASNGNVGHSCNCFNCSFTGTQGNYGGTYTRCSFTNMTVMCADGGAATNCLFAQCVGPRLLAGCKAAVNCTFADCDSAGNRLLTMAADGVIRNCIFFNNVHTASGKTVRDDAYISLNGALVADHNVYGETVFDFSQYGADNFQVSKVKFVGAGEHPYQLAYSQKDARIRTGGAVGDWTADDKDRAGNPRLHGEGAAATIGLGCYECWTMPKGLMLLLK